jgi:DNA-binding CsgD family transcriptional regulator
MSDQPGKIVRELRAPIDRARSGTDVTTLRLELGRALMAQSRFAEAARELEALAALPGISATVRATTLGQLAGALVLSGRSAEGEAIAEEALASDAADAATRVLARSAIRGLRFFEGRFDEAVEHARQIARDAAGAAPMARGEARLDMGGMLFHADQFDEAEPWFELDPDATQSQRREAAETLAMMDLERGRWQYVLSSIPAASAGDADWSDVSRAWRPALRAHALIHVDRSEQAGRELGPPMVHNATPHSLVAWALLAELEGDLAAAGALVERVVALGAAELRHRPRLRIFGLELVRLALAADDPSTAHRMARILEALARMSSVASVRAAAFATRGIVERDANLLEDALRVFAGGPRRVATAQTAEALGAAYREHGDTERAIDALRRALTIWESVGATHDARRSARLLGELGVRTRPVSRRRTLVTGWESLSPTEATVALLVAEGMTNAEVATRLVVSRRTVETHVAHVLAKLALRTRSGIARVAADRSR